MPSNPISHHNLYQFYLSMPVPMSSTMPNTKLDTRQTHFEWTSPLICLLKTPSELSILSFHIGWVFNPVNLRHFFCLPFLFRIYALVSKYLREEEGNYVWVCTYVSIWIYTLFWGVLEWDSIWRELLYFALRWGFRQEDEIKLCFPPSRVACVCLRQGSLCPDNILSLPPSIYLFLLPSNFVFSFFPFSLF